MVKDVKQKCWKGLLFLIIILWNSNCFAKTGVGLHAGPGNYSGASIRYWSKISPSGFQGIGSFELEGKEYYFTLTGRMLYRIKNEEKLNLYLGLGLQGWLRRYERWRKEDERKTEEEGGITLEALFGGEYPLTKDIYLNLEIGTGERKRGIRIHLNGLGIHMYSIGVGIGIHYYF